MDRAAGEAVGHFDAEGGERVTVVRFGGKEAERRVDEGVEGFFGREVGGVARDARPVERCRVDRVVPWATFHERQGRSDVVLDLAQLLCVVAPREDVKVCTDRSQPLRPREVKVFLNPRLVNLIAPGITRQRVHVTRLFLETVQVILTVLDKEVLVEEVIAREHESDGRGEGESAVTAVGRKALVAAVGGDHGGQVVGVAERVQAQPVVAHPNEIGAEADVLE